MRRLPKRELLGVLGIVLLCGGGAETARAAQLNHRLTVSPRIEYGAGLSEFFAGRRSNPFPAEPAVVAGRPGLDRFKEAVFATDGYQALRSLYEPLEGPDLDGFQDLLFVEYHGAVRWAGGWSAEARLSSRDISRGSLDDGRLESRAKNTFFVDEVFARYRRWDDWRSLAAGRMLVTAGRGFIHDDYQLAARAAGDLDLLGAAPIVLTGQFAKIEGEHLDETSATRVPWDGEALFDPDENAFFAQAGAALPISMLESVGVTYARFQERDGYFADLFNPMLAENVVARQSRQSLAETERIAGIAGRALSAGVPPRIVLEGIDAALLAEFRRSLPVVEGAEQGLVGASRSFLNYVTFEGDKLWGKCGFGWLAAGQWGRVTLTEFSRPSPLPDRVDIATRGLLLYGNADYAASRRWLFRVHYLFSSGDSRRGDDLVSMEKYDGFLGVRPYIRLTNLFFSGGISENLRSGSITPSGYNGHGVWAPVLEVQWRPVDDVTVAATGAYLHAQRDPLPLVDAAGQRLGPERNGEYGWEADLMVFYMPLDWLRVAGEADYFLTGDFFADKPDVWKVGAGLDFIVAP